MEKEEIIFFGIFITWGIVVLSLIGFGVWVILKLLSHFGII